MEKSADIIFSTTVLFQTKQLVHKTSANCLTTDGRQGVVLDNCNEMNERQIWILEGYRPDGHIPQTELDAV